MDLNTCKIYERLSTFDSTKKEPSPITFKNLVSSLVPPIRPINHEKYSCSLPTFTETRKHHVLITRCS